MIPLRTHPGVCQHARSRGAALRSRWAPGTRPCTTIAAPLARNSVCLCTAAPAAPSSSDSGVAPSVSASSSPSSSRRLLVLNAGSSSLKFKTFTLGDDGSVQPGVGGVFERIGDEQHSGLVAKGASDTSGTRRKWELAVPACDHVAAMTAILAFLKEHVSPSMADEVVAVGHRVVHGLDTNQPVRLDASVVDTIRKAQVLAPLHNGAALQGIDAAGEVFGSTPQVAVFDTAFHATMPPAAYMYGLPYQLYTDHHIRRYGFHGTSHGYLVGEAAAMLGQSVDETNVITCHLGNGSSIAAVRGGQCIDTSMGMTPLEGLLMGSRSGDVDPAVVLHLQTELGLSVKETDTLLNKKSGLLGLCGDNDLRGVIASADAGDARAALALSMFVYRIKKYIGAYLAALGGRCHAVVFSAGIGENSARVRSMVCDGLEPLGISVDKIANEQAVGVQADVSGEGASTRVLVIPTDEELSIAQQALGVVTRGGTLAL